jgi:hypothetical protein
MPTEITSFLPYHEPSIVTILTQSSLILILNVINTIFDKLIFCGLLGQVFVGVAWGTPGAKWLGEEIEDVIVQLGYLGLILLVYEGMEAFIFLPQILIFHRWSKHKLSLVESKFVSLSCSSNHRN